MPGGEIALFTLAPNRAQPDRLDFTKAAALPRLRTPLGSDLSEYVEVSENLQRHLYRIPLH